MAKEKTVFPALQTVSANPAVDYARKAIHWWLPVLYALISNAFYLRTYDSAQVKITLVQMGGLVLVTLWTCLLSLEGKKAFRRGDMVFLAPFLIYLGYIVLSFINVPYKWLSVDDFVRYFVYMAVALIVIREFDEAAIARLTKILVIGAVITVLYGVVQIADTRLSSPELGIMWDPFLWRSAFGPRVFSTYGNPNFFADFTLIFFFIFVAQYLKTRNVLYIPIIIADLACLYCTETKGAWLGFAIGFGIFIAIYSVFFLRDYYERHKWKINAAAAAVVIGCLIAVAVFAARRMQSVNFRVFTWLSSWEMIESKPLTGTGVGCFKVIYPSFRRPQIFHIEGKHNTETDHAENEYLEQWIDNGAIGFGVFLWFALFTLVTGLRSLGESTRVLARTGMRAPPQAYDLLGYLTAFTAMMSHGICDVSLRFVSSGIYLGLLPGLVIAIARGHALYELHADAAPAAKPAKEEENQAAGYAITALQIAAGAAIIWFLWKIFRDFAVLQDRRYEGMSTPDFLQWHIAWFVLGSVCLWLAWMFLRLARLSRKALPLLLMLAMIYPLLVFWGFFRANVNHNLAIYYSKNKDWDKALHYYWLVNKDDPAFVMAYYFRGNVYKDRFDMTPQYRPEWGDSGNVARTDYERATAEYKALLKYAPNYVQTHYQMGELYMKMYDYQLSHGNAAQAPEYLDRALGKLNLYHDMDPVFPYTYYHRARIYEVRGEFDKAAREYEENINAPGCATKGHKHETPEAYIYMGLFNAQRRRLYESEAAFKRALELDPNNQVAKTNYQVVENMKRLGGGAPLSQPSRPKPAAPVDEGVHITLP